MKFLIDTNIIISRESNAEIPIALQELVRLMNEYEIKAFVHPSSKDDLQRDKDEKRKSISLSKTNTYLFLEQAPNYKEDNEFKNKIGFEKKDNDRVDNLLIYALYKNAIDFLITEDQGILKKCERLELKGALTINGAIELIKRLHPKAQIKSPPALCEKLIYSISTSCNFFDTLKRDYPKFMEWWNKISKEHRKAWVYCKDNDVGAILVYKIEDEEIKGNPTLPKKKRLKICTLKVAKQGNRIGELFLKISFEKAMKEKIDEVYLTHFVHDREKDLLLKLLYNAGFEEVSKRDDGEIIFSKRLKITNKEDIKGLNKIEINRKFYPSFYDGLDSNKFLIPIQPKWHNRLFIGCSGRQTTISEFDGNFIVEGNTIEKAYLTHSKIKKIKEGDLVIFYRSNDRKEITSIGVVKNVFNRLKNNIDVIKIVGNRTVYSEKEINEMVKKPLTIILFRWHFDFKKPIKLTTLKKDKILTSAPQTVSQLKEEGYKKLIEMSNIDQSFIIHTI
jgi:predicted nucleic acid-binding protein